MDVVEDSDWYLVLDNDVLCTGPFMQHLDDFDPKALYGAQIKDWEVFHFLIGWCTFISKECWQDTGPMDESFYRWGYQEVDFCYRAIKNGYRQECIGEFPFTHFGHGSHQFLPDIEEWRKVNMKRFKVKHGL